MAAKPTATKAKVKVTPETVKTSVARAKVSLPANAEDIMAQAVAKLSSQLAVPTGKTIKCQNKHFVFPGNDGETVQTFRGIIVRFVSYNAFYENPWVEGANAPPNCFALGEAKHDDLCASENSPEPEHPEDDNACSSCWASKFKSAANGKAKRCSNTTRLAILCQDGEVRTLSLSSTAITKFSEYVNSVVAGFQTAPFGVMTEFSFDPGSTFGSVRCGNPIKLNQDQLAVAMSLHMDTATLDTLMREPDVSEFEAKVVALRAKVVKAPSKAARAARA